MVVTATAAPATAMPVPSDAAASPDTGPAGSFAALLLQAADPGTATTSTTPARTAVAEGDATAGSADGTPVDLAASSGDATAAPVQPVLTGGIAPGLDALVAQVMDDAAQARALLLPPF